MSASKVLAQGVPCLLVSFPGWKQPTFLHLRATISGGAGAATIVSATDATTGDAGTTVDFGITNTGGIYDVTFNACRSMAMGTIAVQLLPNVLATVTEWRVAAIDKTDANTSAKLGKLRFSLATLAGVVTAPVAGSELNLSFWADLG